MRQIYDFHEAAERFFGGDAEGLRQAALLGHVRALAEFHGIAHAAPWDEPDETSGRTGICNWRRAIGYDKEECPAYELHGWFYLSQESVQKFIGVERDRMLVTGGFDQPIQEIAYFSPDRDGKVTLFGPIYTNDMQFLAAEMTAIGLKPDAVVSEKKPLHSRTKNNLLRIIAALCKEAKIDPASDKATAQMRAALDAYGFKSPDDKSVRGFLKEASALDPD